VVKYGSLLISPWVHLKVPFKKNLKRKKEEEEVCNEALWFGLSHTHTHTQIIIF
jgi:hypothetical protein